MASGPAKQDQLKPYDGSVTVLFEPPAAKPSDMPDELSRFKSLSLSKIDNRFRHQATRPIRSVKSYMPRSSDFAVLIAGSISSAGAPRL